MPFDSTKPADHSGLSPQAMRNRHHSMVIAVLLALGGILQAQDNPTPAPAAAPAQTEMQKWIAATDAQWQAAFKRDVTDVHEAEVKKVMLQYLTLLEDAIDKASKASDLDGAVALRNEQKRFGDTQLFPEQDEAGDPAAVKQARAGIRSLLAKLKTDSDVRAKALHAKYDQVLAQAQAQLTQRQRLDDALLVRAKREEVSAAWLTPAAVAVIPNPVTVSVPAQKTGMIRSGSTAATPSAASKDRPFVNSLGMEFVPVPGTQVLFCRWETRVKDYRAYALGRKVDDAWKKQQMAGVPAGREPEHPVCGMRWHDAMAFCEWLTKTESDTGKLPKGMRYRLPRDEEWSHAVGMPEEQGATPKERDGKEKTHFPWGSGFPPPEAKVGNYADSAYHERFPKEKVIEGYTDGYATTAPVGSFAPNTFGICDLGGNVWEWCEDQWEPGKPGYPLRGASFYKNTTENLLSSRRIRYSPTARFYDFGFRCVLEMKERGRN